LLNGSEGNLCYCKSSDKLPAHSGRLTDVKLEVRQGAEALKDEVKHIIEMSF